MNQAIKEKWVSALRELGTRKPGTVYYSSLRAGDNFAPDGVLCDIYLKENDLQWGG